MTIGKHKGMKLIFVYEIKYLMGYAYLLDVSGEVEENLICFFRLEN